MYTASTGKLVECKNLGCRSTENNRVSDLHNVYYLQQWGHETPLRLEHEIAFFECLSFQWNPEV